MEMQPRYYQSTKTQQLPIMETAEPLEMLAAALLLVVNHNSMHPGFEQSEIGCFVWPIFLIYL